MEGGGWLSTTGATLAGASAVSSVPVRGRSKFSAKVPSGNACSNAEGFDLGTVASLIFKSVPVLRNVNYQQ